jgi:hypothetical protein
MLDLMFLAIQTDSTRFLTYQMGNMNGATSIATKFPSLLGFGKISIALPMDGTSAAEPKLLENGTVFVLNS